LESPRVSFIPSPHWGKRLGEGVQPPPVSHYHHQAITVTDLPASELGYRWAIDPGILNSIASHPFGIPNNHCIRYLIRRGILDIRSNCCLPPSLSLSFDYSPTPLKSSPTASLFQGNPGIDLPHHVNTSKSLSCWESKQPFGIRCFSSWGIRTSSISLINAIRHLHLFLKRRNSRCAFRRLPLWEYCLPGINIVHNHHQLSLSFCAI